MPMLQGGEPIVWLIGVDEVQGAVGVDATNLANWYPAIVKHFEGGVAPDLDRDINFNRNGKTVVALMFRTDRPPYVVTRNDSGNWINEVPWREGTRVRPASRIEILQTVVPTISSPNVSVVEAHVRIGSRKDTGGKIFREILGWLTLFIAPRSADFLAIPSGGVHMSVGEPGARKLFLGMNNFFEPSAMFHRDDAGLLIRGPGSVSIKARNQIPDDCFQMHERLLELSLMMPLADGNTTITVSRTLRFTGIHEDIAYWGSGRIPVTHQAKRIIFVDELK